MKIEKDKVHGSTAAGERHSRRYWPGMGEDEEGVDYEALFRSFMEKLFANRGAFKVDGSLLFEFLPKAHVRNEKLISAETSFCFHQMEESMQFATDIHENDNHTGSAIIRYFHHNNASKSIGRIEEFMPMI
jgi:hypothetical protein